MRQGCSQAVERRASAFSIWLGLKLQIVIHHAEAEKMGNKQSRKPKRVLCLKGGREGSVWVK
jgi:hypothetical protein